jgi:hypothetical protein
MPDGLPDLVFVGGKKKSGKDFVCDRLVAECGYHKLHIVRPWLEDFCRRHGITYAEMEANKARWRATIQAEAEESRAANPDRLIDPLRRDLPTLPRPLCVTAVRFVNEAEFGRAAGGLVVRVVTPDAVRRDRFLADGEDLSLLDDPFERQVDLMPVHAEVAGTLPPESIVPTLRRVAAERFHR